MQIYEKTPQTQVWDEYKIRGTTQFDATASTLRLIQAQDISRCQPEKLTAIFSRSASKGISCLGEDCLAPADSSLTPFVKQPLSFVNAFRGFSITKSIALWFCLVKWFFKKFGFNDFWPMMNEFCQQATPFLTFLKIKKPFFLPDAKSTYDKKSLVF